MSASAEVLKLLVVSFGGSNDGSKSSGKANVSNGSRRGQPSSQPLRAEEGGKRVLAKA